MRHISAKFVLIVGNFVRKNQENSIQERPKTWKKLRLWRKKKVFLDSSLRTSENPLEQELNFFGGNPFLLDRVAAYCNSYHEYW